MTPPLQRWWQRLLGRPQPSRKRAMVPSPHVGPAGSRLAGRSAVVIGAGPNIGCGIARALARESARVVVTNASRLDLGTVHEQLRADGLEVLTLHSDVTDNSAADVLLRRLDDEGMAPDIVVFNVGRHPEKGEPSLPEMMALFRTNVIGPHYLARRIAERLRARRVGGSFLFVSSIHQWTVSGMPLYSATKGAVGMLVHELALEYAPDGIRVNAIAPGWVAAGPDGTPRPHRFTPLHRTSVLPDAIGHAAVFLSDEATSGHTTGAVLTVDGGLSLVNYLVGRPAPPDAG